MNAILIFERYPWARLVKPDIDTREGFYDVTPWNFTDEQLAYIDALFGEIDDFFKSKGLPADIVIYDVRSIFDRLEVEYFTNTPEVRLIIEKYIKNSVGLF